MPVEVSLVSFGAWRSLVVGGGEIRGSWLFLFCWAHPILSDPLNNLPTNNLWH